MMSTMGRPARRLFDLEIDEVSAVDRPANQHGLISISKSLGTDDTPEEGGMTIYDENGVEVFEDELQVGATYRDDNGNELVYIEDGEAAEDHEPVLAGVGKGLVDSGVKGFKASMGGWKPGSELGSAGKAGAHLGRNRKRYAAGAAALGTGAAGGAAGAAMSKSLGDDILEQFSKAVTDADREKVIAKALDRVGQVEAENQELRKSFDELEDERITEAYIAKAAEYELPVSPAVLGPILKAIVPVLDDEQLEVVDRLFSASSDVFKEAGYTGGALNGGIVDEVTAMSAELVGKAAGGLTMEQASTAIFETNPEAYDEYLRNTMGR